MPQAHGSRALSKNYTHCIIRIKGTREELHEMLPFSRSVKDVPVITNGFPKGHWKMKALLLI